MASERDPFDMTGFCSELVVDVDVFPSGFPFCSVPTFTASTFALHLPPVELPDVAVPPICRCITVTCSTDIHIGAITGSAACVPSVLMTFYPITECCMQEYKLELDIGVPCLPCTVHVSEAYKGFLDVFSLNFSAIAPTGSECSMELDLSLEIPCLPLSVTAEAAIHTGPLSIEFDVTRTHGTDACALIHKLSVWVPPFDVTLNVTGTCDCACNVDYSMWATKTATDSGISWLLYYSLYFPEIPPAATFGCTAGSCLDIACNATAENCVLDVDLDMAYNCELTGPTGTVGDMGISGTDGVTGPTGTVGDPGAGGATGTAATGWQGQRGVSFGGVPWPYKGAMGATGLAYPDPGPTGPTGQPPKGAVGPAGDGGSRGPRGDDGSSAGGERGVTGPGGEKGVDGPTGETGVGAAPPPPGDDGPQGPSGYGSLPPPPGDDGPQGPTGPEGDPDKGAIVPIGDKWLSLSCIEAPDVWFWDCLQGHVQSGKTVFLIDTRFVAACATGTIRPISIVAADATVVSFVVAGDEVIIESTAATGIIVWIAGTRKNFGTTHRFKPFTEAAAAQNAAFWAQAKGSQK